MNTLSISPSADADTEPAISVLDQLRRLDAWLQAHDYAAYDPFDGLNAWLRPLALGRLGRQLLQQGVRRCPWNLRPLLGIRPSASSKGFGALARAYLKLHARYHDPADLAKAVHGLDWLIEHGNTEHGGIGWGNHFDYQSRVFYLPQGQPTLVWTAQIGHAFLDAWNATEEERYLRITSAVCDFILHGLERRDIGPHCCIGYIPGRFCAVHNANMLGAAFLARVAAQMGDTAMLAVARRAVDYTVAAQRPDHSWWYGEADDLHWVDSFHTGYVLDSLAGYMAASGDERHRTAFDRGAAYFVAHFIGDDGRPHYYADGSGPIDIQCAAQTIETLSLLARAQLEPKHLRLARRVARWTFDHLQDPSGYFWFRRHPWAIDRTPMLHWGQATMMLALATLLQQGGGDEA